MHKAFLNVIKAMNNMSRQMKFEHIICERCCEQKSLIDDFHATNDWCDTCEEEHQQLLAERLQEIKEVR